jgi:biotin operon repressor
LVRELDKPLSLGFEGEGLLKEPMNGFWAIPKSLALRRDLSPKAKLIAGILWTRRDGKSRAFPSKKYMAEALGLSEKSVGRAIKELREKAGLKVKRRGQGKTNLYSLPNWDGKTLSPLKGKRPSFQDGTTLSSRRDFIKDNTYVEKSSVTEIISFFKNRVKEMRGYEPEISWGKDGRLIKERLKKYSLRELKELIDWYLSSEHSLRLGDCLSICLSAGIINLWKAHTTLGPYRP